MKRQIYPSTSSAIGWWANNPNALKADCFAVTLPTGQTLCATEGQWDINTTFVLLLTARVSGGVSLTVDGRCCPWNDAAYAFRGMGDGLPPMTIPVAPGDVVQIAYSGGTWTQGGPTGSWTAAGSPGALVTPGTGMTDVAGGRCLVNTLAAELLGSWADSSGDLVAAPFPIGLAATLTAPAGAVKLQLGINDGISFSDNSGSINVAYTINGPDTAALTTFYATRHGRWSRGKITSAAGYRCAGNTTTLSIVPQMGAVYPGLGISVLNAAFNHLFDGAQVWIYTAWMPFGEYGNVQVLETKFQGTITTRPVLDRNLVTFDCADPFFLLNLKVPSRLLQSNCPWSFCDDNCGLSAANYTVNFTAASDSTQYVLTPWTAFTQAAGYFAQGVVTCLTGANAGLSQTVKLHASGNLSMTVPWLMPVAAGDTFFVIKGCDKTLTTCAGTKRANGTLESNNYKTRYGGTPFTPAPSSSV